MIKTILVPLDSSEFSQRAVPYAEAIARSSHAEVILGEAVLISELPTVEAQAYNREVSSGPRKALAATASSLRRAGIQVQWHLWHNDPPDAIASAARDEPAQLIVMATHARRGVQRWIFGSVAERVLDLAPVPLLLIPGTASSWETIEPFRIIAPIDDSPRGNAAIDAAIELAAAMAGE